MNQFQGPGRDWPPITREDDTYPRLKMTREEYREYNADVPDFPPEDPDTLPLGVTEDDEDAAARELAEWGYNPFDLED